MRLMYLQLTVGMYDGNIAVYNLQGNTKEPIYDSLGMASKHNDPVWEVKFGRSLCLP